jgi:hypothetical protein
MGSASVIGRPFLIEQCAQADVFIRNRADGFGGGELVFAAVDQQRPLFSRRRSESHAHMFIGGSILISLSISKPS